ncbi:MAG TPA: DUF4388 domain-containing protein [Myxococcota bacterium]|nr:DUF4388 domain-containing protein [Myxococcota bacterium]
MSLAGNLSDLSLPELLQVVALSRKTGALEICSEQGGVAWLGLRDGGIVRVALESGDLNRDEILRKAGLDEGGDSDVAAAMLWDAAVQAILAIFDWAEGDFTFEPLDDPALQWRGPQGILLPSPLSPEFLALEGARLEDESAAQNVDVVFEGEEPPAKAEPAVTEPEPEPEPEEIEVTEAEPEPIAASAEEVEEEEVEAAPAPSVPEIEPPPEQEPAPDLEAAPLVPPREDDDTPVRMRLGVTPASARPALRDPDATVVSGTPLADSDEPVTTEVRVPGTAKLPTSLICIDADLPLLEKLKSGLASQPIRVHIFQSPADALARFKQYVVRGEIPAVVLGSAVEDPIDARQGLGWRRFAGRMLAIAPRMRLVVLAKLGEKVAAPGLAVLHRPEPRPKPGDLEHFLRALTNALASGA